MHEERRGRRQHAAHCHPVTFRKASQGVRRRFFTHRRVRFQGNRQADALAPRNARYSLGVGPPPDGSIWSVAQVFFFMLSESVRRALSPAPIV